jgi:uncharacterized RDD family membrane protein YckC
MKPRISHGLRMLVFAGCLSPLLCFAQQAAPAPVDSVPSPPALSIHRTRGDKDAVVSIGHDSLLAAGAHADSMVSILGSAVVAGELSESVVSILGDTHLSGSVGDAAVSILGNTYIDGTANDDVIAVLGNVELGPHAQVAGDVVVLGGTVRRDPAAVVRGKVQNLSFGPQWRDFGWLRTWVARCLLYGRLLAFSPGLAWAWTLALLTLAAYVVTALLFRSGVERCLQTLERRPGQSVLAALLTTLATPVLLLLLCISVVGILAIPFIGISLLIAGAFGKLVMLAWIGRRITRGSGGAPWNHPATSVLIGGLIVTLLYAVPVLGLLTYKLLGFIGLGAVMYALLLALQARQLAAHSPAAGSAGAMPSSDGAASRSAAASAQSGTGAAGATDAASGTGAASAAAAGGAGAESSAGAAGSASSAAASAAASVDEAVVSSTAGAALATTCPRAGFWIRMGALFIDMLLIGIIMHVVFDMGRLHLLVLAAYGVVMWKLRGTTVGGIVCNLYVVRLDGRKLDWGTAIVRALACFLSLFFAGLGFIWIAIDHGRQAWHDKIAGTIVVRLPKGVSLI